MIWEKRVFIIVMLTPLKEHGRSKCEMYWPEDEEENTVEYSGLKITLVPTEQVDEDLFTIRKMTLFHKEQNESRNITQFHFEHWADHASPEATSHFLKLLDNINKCNAEDDVILVHCR